MKMSDLNIPKSEIENLIESYVYVVRNKQIFYMKLEGYTYEELAEMYNLSVTRTKGIVKECLDKISNHI